ncbi:hypothetical protein EDD16DRAFT_1454466, partial [Pisolithus croceorrhizus]
RSLCACKQHDLLGCVRLDELKAIDSVYASCEGRGQCTLDEVQVNEQTVDLDVARAPTPDCDRAIGLHASYVVGVQEHLFAVPSMEHVTRRFHV